MASEGGNSEALLEGSKRGLDAKSALCGAGVVLLIVILGGVVPLVVVAPWNNTETVEAAVTWPQCNMNGVWTQDTQQCECYQCIQGPNCTNYVAEVNCRISATIGQPYVMQEFWNNYTKGLAPTHISATSMSWRGPYQNPARYSSAPSATDNSLDAQLNRAIRELHAKYNNVIIGQNDSILISTGATQMWSALMWSIAANTANASGTIPLYVFERTPYYFGHPNMVEGGVTGEILNPNLVQWNASYNLPADQVIEVLTQPSNPLGDFYSPIYPTGNKRIFDTVYYWPHLTPMGAPFNETVMIFSLTKLSGNAATRFGWAIVKDSALASTTSRFISDNTIGPSVDIKWRALNIIREVSSPSCPFISTVEQVMKDRWVRINAWFKGQSRFQLLSQQNTAYIWLLCLLPQDSDCYAVFSTVGIDGYPASRFGDTPNKFRINLTLHSYAFDLLMQKLYKLTAPGAQDMKIVQEWISQLPPPPIIPRHVSDSEYVEYTYQKIR